MIRVAVLTLALRLATAQHCGALDVHGAQAGLQVYSFYELRSAALHAARPGSAACYVPLLKHGDVGVAVRRHAVCQCTGELKHDACYIALEVVWRSIEAALVYSKEYSTLSAACALEAPPFFERGEHLFSAGAGHCKAARAAQGGRQAHQGAGTSSRGGGARTEGAGSFFDKELFGAGALFISRKHRSCSLRDCPAERNSCAQLLALWCTPVHSVITLLAYQMSLLAAKFKLYESTSMHAPLKASLQCVRLQSTPRPSKFADVPIMAVAYTCVQRVPTSQQCSQQCVLRNAALWP